MLEINDLWNWIFLMYFADSIYAFKFRKNHNYGPNGIWVGNRAIMVLCVVGIVKS